MMVIVRVYNALCELNLVETQEQFSVKFMGKSPRYYSYLLAVKREPSIQTAYALATRLDMLAQSYSAARMHKGAIHLGEMSALLLEDVKNRSLAAVPSKRSRLSTVT